MSIFHYNAKNLKGERISGVEEADGINELKYILYERGYMLIDAKKQGSKGILSQFGRVSMKEFSIFCRQFSVILNSGLTILEAVKILSQQTEKKSFKLTLEEVHLELQKGKMLSNILRENKETFPDFFTNMVQVGETSGTLDLVLERMANYYENEYKMTKKVKGAMTYPFFVVVIASAVVVLLLVKVIPMFAEMLDSMGGNLPALTLFMMDLSNFLVNHFVTLFLVLSVGILVVVFYFSTEAGQYRKDYIKLNLPIIKNLTRKVATAKFSRSMGMLLKSGIPIVRAIEIMGDLLSNKVLEEKFEETKNDVKSGKSIALAIEKIDVFPPLIYHMVSVGEKTGELDDMLLRTSEFFDKEVEYAIEQMIGLIEPLLIVGLAFVVVSILLAVMLPMAEILQTIS